MSRLAEIAFADPLRIVRGRFWLWAAILALSAAAPVWWTLSHDCGDWRAFVTAGMRVGTPGLLRPPELWQAFVYLPAGAYAIAPLAHLPLVVGFTIDAIFMIACAAAAAFLISSAYRIPKPTAIGLVFAWWPTLYAAVVVGQNATFGLLCTVATIAGMAKRGPLLTAIPLGILLYKPTYAMPLIAVLVLRSRFRELGYVAAIGVGWYALSVLATGGEWLWPHTLVDLIRAYAAQDFRVNATLAISLPGLLVRAGAPAAIVAAVVVVVAAAAVIPIRRVEPLEAGTAASLIGLALSPHAWAYDAVMVVPMIAYAVTTLREPLRTRLTIAAYLGAPLAFLTPIFRFDPLAVTVLGGSIGWIVARGFAPAAMIALHELEPIAD